MTSNALPTDIPLPGDIRGEDGEFHVGTQRVSPDMLIVEPRGQADIHTAPALREALSEAIESGGKVVVVDLSGVTFVDSMTLGVLLGAVKRLRQRGGELRIIVDDPHVRRVFEITLLDRVFDLFTDRSLALKRD
jgi:anti-sigma B factor antagonist